MRRIPAKDHKYNKIGIITAGSELEIHTHIEETVFYSTIEEQEELKDMVAEALEEHQQAKMLLNELEGLGADNHDFGSKL